MSEKTGRVRSADVVALIALGVIALLIVLPYRFVVVGGSSMEPALAPGDICIVHTGACAQRGDIVLVDLGGGDRVLHRVVRIDSRSVTTKGDANATEDRCGADRTRIRGTVVARLGLGAAVGGWIRRVAGGTLHNQSHS